MCNLSQTISNLERRRYRVHDAQGTSVPIHQNPFSLSLRLKSRYLGYIILTGPPLYTLTLAECFCVLAVNRGMS